MNSILDSWNAYNYEIPMEIDRNFEICEFVSLVRVCRYSIDFELSFTKLSRPVHHTKDEHIFQDVQKQVEYNILSELAKRAALRCAKIIGESVTFCTFYYNELFAVTKETSRKSFGHRGHSQR